MLFAFLLLLAIPFILGVIVAIPMFIWVAIAYWR